MKARHVALLATVIALIPGWMDPASAQDTVPPEPAPPEVTVPVKPMSWVVLPALFYSPETRWGGGAAVFLAHRRPAASRPTTGHVAVLYTQERQSTFEVAGDRYTAGDAYRITGFVGYRKYPGRLYGVGNQTPDDAAEDYTPRIAEVRVTVERAIRPNLRAGVSYGFATRTMLEVEEGGMLDRRLLPGAEGGITSGAGVTLAWDDRDNVFAPERGHFHALSSQFYGRVLGSDHTLSVHTLDLRSYRPVRAGHVLAVQAVARATTGDPPFHLMSAVGGQNLLRGLYDGRYRDRHAVIGQAEYRAHLWWRLGAVGFAGAGQVASQGSDLRLDGFHLTGGGGIRFALDPRERMNLRIDYGVAQGGSSGLYLTVGEAF